MTIEIDWFVNNCNPWEILSSSNAIIREQEKFTTKPVIPGNGGTQGLALKVRLLIIRLKKPAHGADLLQFVIAEIPPEVGMTIEIDQGIDNVYV